MAFSHRTPSGIYDHITHFDESYPYIGNHDKELVKVLEGNIKILQIYGPVYLGKTRLAKTVARQYGEAVNGGPSRQRVHMYMVQMNSCESKEDFLQEMCQYVVGNSKGSFKDLQLGLRSNKDSVQGSSKDSNLFIIDGIEGSETYLADVMQWIVTLAEDAMFIITSGVHICFGRFIQRGQYHEHLCRQMMPEDAKQLLRAAAGNQSGLNDDLEEKTIRLTKRVPWAVILAGQKMKPQTGGINFSPQEVVELLEKSVFDALQLGYAPRQDRIGTVLEDYFKSLNPNEKRFVVKLEKNHLVDTFTTAAAYEAVPEKSPTEVKCDTLGPLVDKTLLSSNEDHQNGRSFQSNEWLDDNIKERFLDFIAHSRNKFVEEIRQLINTYLKSSGYSQSDINKVYSTRSALTRPLKEAIFNLIDWDSNVHMLESEAQKENRSTRIDPKVQKKERSALQEQVIEAAVYLLRNGFPECRPMEFAKEALKILTLLEDPQFGAFAILNKNPHTNVEHPPPKRTNPAPEPIAELSPVFKSVQESSSDGETSPTETSFHLQQPMGQTPKPASGTVAEKMESDEFKNFAQVHEAIKRLTRRCIPLMSDTFETWHQVLKEKLGDCQSKVTHQLTTRTCTHCEVWKQESQACFYVPCTHCEVWKQEIQACFYVPPSDKGQTLKWTSINSCKLHTKSFEVAKLFATGELPQELYDYGDFDAAHLLTLLMTCSKFHQGDTKCYDAIKQIKEIYIDVLLDMRATPTRPALDELMRIMMNLVNMLKEKHPNHFGPEVIADIQADFSQLLMMKEFQPYMPTHEALHFVTHHLKPAVTECFLKWYERSKMQLKPCNSPSTCPSKYRANGMKGLCKNCVTRVKVLKKASNQLDEKYLVLLENNSISELQTNPSEAVKIFLPELQQMSVLNLDSLETKSIWRLMRNFAVLNKKHTKFMDAVQSIIGNFRNLFYMRVKESAYLEENIVDKNVESFKNVITCFHKTQPHLIAEHQIENMLSELDKMRHLKIKGFEISRADLTFGDKIARGRFSKFQASYSKPNGEKCEVVLQRLDSIDKEKLNLMKSLQHPNIVQPLGIYCDDRDTYLVTEYARKGNLRSYLNGRKGPPPPHLIKKWSREVCEAIQYLHSNKCIHTEVGSTNFLIAEDDSLKLSSLELVKEWDQTKSARGSHSCRWMAPEVVVTQFRSIKSDIFSLGIVLWELCTGEVPYGNNKRTFDQMNAIVEERRPPVPENWPKLKSILESCWKQQCKQRPSVDELIKTTAEAILEMIEEQQRKPQASVSDSQCGLPSQRPATFSDTSYQKQLMSKNIDTLRRRQQELIESLGIQPVVRPPDVGRSPDVGRIEVDSPPPDNPFMASHEPQYLESSKNVFSNTKAAVGIDDRGKSHQNKLYLRSDDREDIVVLNDEQDMECTAALEEADRMDIDRFLRAGFPKGSKRPDIVLLAPPRKPDPELVVLDDDDVRTDFENTRLKEIKLENGVTTASPKNTKTVPAPTLSIINFTNSANLPGIDQVWSESPKLAATLPAVAISPLQGATEEDIDKRIEDMSQLEKTIQQIQMPVKQDNLQKETQAAATAAAAVEKNVIVIKRSQKGTTCPYRPIVIDGSNVAMLHGKRHKTFSCQGIALCVQYFQKRGAENITVFVPQWRQTQDAARLDQPIRNKEILDILENQGLLSFTPSRTIGGQHINSYDDRFIVRLAVANGGNILSNDQFRDLIDESKEWKNVIDTRLLVYTFAGGEFMIADDPYGRHGPTLEELLLKPGAAHRTSYPPHPQTNKVPVNFVNRSVQTEGYTEGKLIHQLDLQRSQFEDKIECIEQETFNRISEEKAKSKKIQEELARVGREMQAANKEKADAVKNKAISDQKCNQFCCKLNKLNPQLNDEKQMNKCLMEKIADLNTQLAVKQKEIEDLKDQLRDVMFFLDTQQKISEASEETQKEIQEGQIIIGAAAPDPKSHREKRKVAGSEGSKRKGRKK